MPPYHKYMLFYTGLQVVGVYGILELEKWIKKNNKNNINNKAEN